MLFDKSDSSSVRDILIAVYRETWAEIGRLRAYEWKIAYYFVAMSAGTMALLSSASLHAIWTFPVKCVLTAVEVASLGFGVYYLEVTHRHLTQQRNIRRVIEDHFALSNPEAWDGLPILPVEWKGRVITSNFQRMGLLVPIMLMVILVHALAVYVVWS